MAFMEMNSGGRFIAWGKDKAKDNSFIVEKGKSITGLINNIKRSDSYGLILEVKIKECDEPIIILGTSLLVKALGYEKIDDKLNTYKDNIREQESPKAVQSGEVIRITFIGMIPTKRGKEAYDFKVEVDR